MRSESSHTLVVERIRQASSKIRKALDGPGGSRGKASSMPFTSLKAEPAPHTISTSENSKEFGSE